MSQERRSLVLAAALALLIAITAVFFWPILPIDETRYLSVAWEMWLRGDFLVPHLNGREYSHKPPLLFWVFNAGWWVFGVNSWWPRLVPALFSAASALLTVHMARLLWPSEGGTAAAAPLILQASGLWMMFTAAIMFDMPLAFWVLLAMTGVVRAWRGRRGGWILCGIGLGLGILTKGPVTLLHVLPVALIAPLWMRDRRARPTWPRWYGGSFLALAIGAAIALAWAIPAAMRGSPEYGAAIFWSQSAHRIADSFAHAHPFWWYVPFIPLIVFPWSLWKPVWTGFARVWRGGLTGGTRFCVAWTLTILVVFSLLSAKQPHYLLPFLPALVLLIARAVTRPEPASQASPQASAPAGALERRLSRVRAIAAVCVAATALVSAVAMHVLSPKGQDITPMAARLKQLEAERTPVAHVGSYQGQYQFLGRLERPLDVLRASEVRQWASAHPNGRLVVYVRAPLNQKLPAEYMQRYRGHYVAIVPAASAAWLPQMEGCCPADEQ